MTEEHISPDKIDFSLQPITAEFLRYHPQKSLILTKYHEWQKKQRIEDKKELKRIESKIYRFKRKKEKLKNETKEE